MMQNPAIDVAIGLILMYLMLSLLCTVINEFIATKLKLRAKSLASALEQLLDHPPLRDTFYQHGLIATNRRVTAIGPQSTLSGIGRIASAAGSAVVRGSKMRKRVYFDVFDGSGWPSPSQLEPYFLAPPGQRWTFDTGNDNWGLKADGVDGTERLEANKGRIDVRLRMWGNRDLGVLSFTQNGVVNSKMYILPRGI